MIGVILLDSVEEIEVREADALEDMIAVVLLDSLEEIEVREAVNSEADTIAVVEVPELVGEIVLAEVVDSKLDELASEATAKLLDVPKRLLDATVTEVDSDGVEEAELMEPTALRVLLCKELAAPVSAELGCVIPVELAETLAGPLELELLLDGEPAVPDAEAISVLEVCAEEVSVEEVSAEEVSIDEVCTEVLSKEEVSAEEVSTDEVCTEELSNKELPKEELSKEEVSPEEATEVIDTLDVPPLEVTLADTELDTEGLLEAVAIELLPTDTVG